MIAVLDAVVHHLDVVAGAAGPMYAHARAVVDLGGDRREDGLDHAGRASGAAGHDARAQQRALFAAAHAGADVEDAGRFAAP